MFHVIFRSALAAPSWMIHERMVVAPHAEGFLERNPVPRFFEGRREDVWGRGADDAIAPIVYSAVFSDHAVLQYGAKTAAVLYGQINERASAATKVTLRMTSAAGEESYSVPAVVDVRDGTWRAQLEPSAAYGGSYTASVSCTTCTNTTATVLRDLTYGDVFFCSGQSKCVAAQRVSLGTAPCSPRSSACRPSPFPCALRPLPPRARALAACNCPSTTRSVATGPRSASRRGTTTTSASCSSRRVRSQTRSRRTLRIRPDGFCRTLRRARARSTAATVRTSGSTATLS